MNESDLRDVAFFGKVTAAYTHEMKNVMAIVKESAGLMEDLLQLASPQAFPHHGRFVRALTSIQDQLRRGVEMTNRLNRFAHSADVPVATIDLHDTVVHLAYLVHRFARLKNVALEVNPAPDHSVSMTTSPVQLQKGLFKGLECCWANLEGGGEIRLSVAAEDGLPAVHVECRPKDIASEGQGGIAERIKGSAGWDAMEEILRPIGGRAEWEASGWGFRVVWSRTVD